jgi:hypothetical protein
MIVEVRRRGETDWAESFAVENRTLDFSGVTDASLREEIEAVFRDEPALQEPYVVWAWSKWDSSDQIREHRAERLTPRWVAFACLSVLNPRGIFTRFDSADLDEESG